MGWQRQRWDAHDEVEQEPGEQDAIKAALAYLVEEEAVASDRRECCCNELVWDLVSAFRLSRLAFSSGRRTTGIQLFCKRRLP